MSDAAEDAAAAPEGQVPAAAPLLPTLRKEMKSAELVKYLKEFSSVQFKEYRTPSGVKIFERAACLGQVRVSSIFSRNLPVLVEIETVEKFLEICRSFRAPVVSRSVPGPGLGKCWPFGPFWQVLRAKVPCCSNILGAKAEI